MNTLVLALVGNSPSQGGARLKTCRMRKGLPSEGKGKNSLGSENGSAREEQQEASWVPDVAQPPLRGSRSCEPRRCDRRADAGVRNFAAAAQPTAPVVP